MFLRPKSRIFLARLLNLKQTQYSGQDPFVIQMQRIEGSAALSCNTNNLSKHHHWVQPWKRVAEPASDDIFIHCSYNYHASTDSPSETSILTLLIPTDLINAPNHQIPGAARLGLQTPNIHTRWNMPPTSVIRCNAAERPLYSLWQAIQYYSGTTIGFDFDSLTWWIYCILSTGVSHTQLHLSGRWHPSSMTDLI